MSSGAPLTSAAVPTAAPTVLRVLIARRLPCASSANGLRRVARRRNTSTNGYGATAAQLAAIEPPPVVSAIPMKTSRSATSPTITVTITRHAWSPYWMPVSSAITALIADPAMSATAVCRAP